MDIFLTFFIFIMIALLGIGLITIPFIVLYKIFK